MQNYINKLYEISKKQNRTIIGLMSGTSLDGLDIAVCNFSGQGLTTRAKIIQFTTIPYEEDFKNEIREIFSKKIVDLEKLCLLNAFIADYHAALILQSLRNWNILPSDIDCIASHGQTIFHAPKRLHGQNKFPNATLQIGDGDHIAVKTGMITLSDFRQKHIAAGGY